MNWDRIQGLRVLQRLANRQSGLDVDRRGRRACGWRLQTPARAGDLSAPERFELIWRRTASLAVPSAAAYHQPLNLGTPWTSTHD